MRYAILVSIKYWRWGSASFLSFIIHLLILFTYCYRSWYDLGHDLFFISATKIRGWKRLALFEE